MAGSPRFRKLHKRAQALRTRFLPAAFSPVGVYPLAVLDHARAYRVLVHAELESYFEDRALELADRTIQVWQNSRRASIHLLCLVASLESSSNRLSRQFGSQPTISTIAHQAVSSFRVVVGGNNGIKSKNLAKLFCPLGFDDTNFDPGLLPMLDSFGGNRGQAAHTSWITYQIDPQSDFNAVTLILQGIANFDSTLSAAIRRLR